MKAKVCIQMIFLAAFLQLSLNAYTQDKCPGLKNPRNFNNYHARIGCMVKHSAGMNPVRGDLITVDEFDNGIAIAAAETKTGVSDCAKDAVISNGTVSPIAQYGNAGGQYSKRFEIVGSGTDPNTCNNLEFLPPDTSFHTAIRIGNTMNGEWEELIYGLNVEEDNALLVFWYAVVMQNPDHGDEYNPKIRIRVEYYDPVRKRWILTDKCTQYEEAASDQAAGKWGTGDKKCKGNVKDANGDLLDIIYKPWTKAIVDLTPHLNDSVRVSLYNQDCIPLGHYSYMYVAGECLPMRLIGAAACAPGGSDTAAIISAPDHVLNYQWQIKNRSASNWSNFNNAGGRDKKQNLILLENDFRAFGALDGILHLKCTFDSYINPGISCKGELTVFVHHLKPSVSANISALCDRWVSFKDQSSINVSGTDVTIDHSKTKWTIEGVDYFGSEIKYQFPFQGEYEIILYVENTEQCFSSRTFKVKASDSLDVAIYPEKSFYCIGDIVKFTAGTLLDSIPQPHKYTWYIGDSVYIGPVFSYQLKGTDTLVALEAESDKGCWRKVFKTLDLEPYPVVSISGEPVVCDGGSTVLTVATDIGDRYEWSYSTSGTPVISFENTFSASPLNDTTAYLAVITQNGCRSVTDLNLYVLRPQITADILNICPGGKTTLTASSTVDHVVTEYLWRAVPEGERIFSQEEKNNIISVSPDETTDYYVTAVTTIGCRPIEGSLRITVYPYPIAEIIVKPEFIDAEEPSVVLTDNSKYGIYTLWELGDGNTSKSRKYTYLYSYPALRQDSITIKLISSNELWCADTASVTLPVDEMAVAFPNAFTPSKMDNNIFYPETHSIFESYHLLIYNRWGELLFETKDLKKGWNGKCGGKDVPDGTYVWTVEYTRPGKNRIYTQKGTVLIIR